MNAPQPDTAAIEARLLRLREQFAARAATHVAMLDALAGRLADEGAPADREEVRRIAHSLAGAGGTFGFAVISKSAAELEDFIAADPDDAALAARIRGTVAAIRDNLAADGLAAGEPAEGDGA